jgi:uncharacterized protein YciI
MLYSIVLTYTRPASEVNRHLESHKDWLFLNVQQGRIIFAGPLEPRTGGMVLASCADLEELTAMMERDAFIEHQVAEYRAYACAPALASADFPAKWAAGAKFIDPVDQHGG